MKIVLLKEVPKLGHKGDIKDVAEGYARNYLIPMGFAELLNKHTLNMLSAQAAKRERVKKQTIQDKSKLVKRISGKTFVITVKTDEKGTLYAGLDKKALSQALKKEGYNIDPEEIKLNRTIKKTGDYKVEVALGSKAVKAEFKITTDNTK